MRGVAFFSRHPIATFVVLVYPLSWYSWLLGIADRIGSTGLNPLGPLVAAIITTWLVGGWPRFREWFGHFTNFRAGLLPFAAALGVPIVLCLAAVSANAAAGAALPSGAQLQAWPGLLEQFAFVLLFIGLGEEPGWRGFLAPEWQKRASPLLAALGVGLVWAIWHAPLFRAEINPAHWAPFLVNVFAAAIVLAWLRNISGSVWPPMICHAAVNTIGAGFLFGFYEGAELTRLWWLYSALWAAAAVAIAVLTGGRLGASDAESPAPARSTAPATAG